MTTTLIFRPYNCLLEGLLTRQFQLSKLGIREFATSIISNIVVFGLYLYLLIRPFSSIFGIYSVDNLFLLHFPEKEFHWGILSMISHIWSFSNQELRKLSSNLLEIYTSKIDDMIIGQTISRANLAVYEVGFQFPQTFRTLTLGSIFGYVVGVYRKITLKIQGIFTHKLG